MLPLKKHKRSRGRHASLPHWPCVVLDIMSASLARYDHRVYSGVSRLSRVQFFDILLCKSAIRRLFFPSCSIAVSCTLSPLFVPFGLDSVAFVWRFMFIRFCCLGGDACLLSGSPKIRNREPERNRRPESGIH